MAWRLGTPVIEYAFSGLITGYPGEGICEWKVALRWPGECYLCVCLFIREEFKNERSMSKNLKVTKTLFPPGTERRTD